MTVTNLFQMNSGSDTNPVYYVYEHYIQDTGEIFYVGKGKENRVEMPTRNDVFNRIAAKYNTSHRIIKSNLTEQAAFDLEEETIKNYLDQGMYLTNIRTPFGYYGAYSFKQDFEYLVRPELIENPVEIHYFGNNDDWDQITVDDLLSTSLDCSKLGPASNIYFRETSPLIYMYGDELLNQLQLHLKDLIETSTYRAAKVYKTTTAKSVKSVILPYSPTESKRLTLRTLNKKVFNLVDVLNFLEIDIEQFIKDNNVIETANALRASFD